MKTELMATYKIDPVTGKYVFYAMTPESSGEAIYVPPTVKQWKKVQCCVCCKWTIDAITKKMCCPNCF